MKLTEELENTIEKCTSLTVSFTQKQLKNLQNSNTSKLLKYTNFFLQKFTENTQLQELLTDRIEESTFLSKLKKGDYYYPLLHSLQLLSDIGVHLSQNTSKDDTQHLLRTVNLQSDRIANLNRKISATMSSRVPSEPEFKI